MNYSACSADEWIEPNGFGGFASGTAFWHSNPALSLTAAHEDKFTRWSPRACEWLRCEGGVRRRNLLAHFAALCAERRSSDGASRIIKFESTPWPRWSFKLTEDLVIEQGDLHSARNFVRCNGWKLIGHTSERVKLKVRLFLFGSRFS